MHAHVLALVMLLFMLCTGGCAHLPPHPLPHHLLQAAPMQFRHGVSVVGGQGPAQQQLAPARMHLGTISAVPAAQLVSGITSGEC